MFNCRPKKNNLKIEIKMNLKRNREREREERDRKRNDAEKMPLKLTRKEEGEALLHLLHSAHHFN